MKTKKIFDYGMVLLTLFILFVGMVNAATTTAVTGATSATQSLTPTNMVLDYDLTRVDSNLKPGDSGVLTVVVKNIGQQAAEDVQILVPSTGDIFVGKQWNVGRIDPLGSKTVSTTVVVSKNAYIGLHTIQVRIAYDGFDYEGDRKNNQLSVWEFPFRVFGNANFQISAGNGTAFYEDVSTKLTLKGTTQDGARDVYATLVPGSASGSTTTCASIIGSSKIYLGALGRGQTFNLEYNIQPNTVGVCPLNLVIDYDDETGSALKETLPLGIDVQRYDVDFKVTDVSYTGASPGSASNITVVLNNVGSATANDVSVTLSLDTPFTEIGSSERFIGKVGSHETKIINFQALIDSAADIKAYGIPMTIEYFDAAGMKNTITKSIGIQVDGSPEIKIFLEKADLFTSGTKGVLTVNVVNKGFAQVKFLNLALLSTDNYDVISSPEAYIGSLDSDSTDNQDYTIQIKNNVPEGKIPLAFQITYKEANSNIDHTDSVNLELNVLSMQQYASQQPAGSTLSLVITAVGALIALIVLVLVLWFVYKVLGAFTGYVDRKLFKRKT